MSNDTITNFEVWDAGGDDVYLYTHYWQIARTLREEFRPTTYSKGNFDVAWQFKLPKRLIKILQRRFGLARKSSEKMTVENQ